MKYEINKCYYIHDKDEYRLGLFHLKVIQNDYDKRSYRILVNRITDNIDFEFYLLYNTPYVMECLKKFLEEINVNYYLYESNIRINIENFNKLTFFCKIYGV